MKRYSVVVYRSICGIEKAVVEVDAEDMEEAKELAFDKADGSDDDVVEWEGHKIKSCEVDDICDEDVTEIEQEDA